MQVAPLELHQRLEQLIDLQLLTMAQEPFGHCVDAGVLGGVAIVVFRMTHGWFLVPTLGVGTDCDDGLRRGSLLSCYPRRRASNHCVPTRSVGTSLYMTTTSP